MENWTRRGFIGSLSAAAAVKAFGAQQNLPATEKRAGQAPIKITDLRCAIIGRNPTVRIVTDQGVSGYGQAESYKPYLKPMVLFYKDYLIGEDPTDVARVMLKIRRMGAFKPWGAAVSAIEIALWDIAGKVAGEPVYKLLGGKIRDRVRIYNGAVRFPMTGHTPQDYAEAMAKMKDAKEGFTLIKQAVGFHDPAMMPAVPNAWYDEPPRKGASHPDRGMMTERGLDNVIACVEAMKKVLGSEIGLALDCGPGWTVKDAITFARALEPLRIAWLEDLITGDYTPYPNAELFREVTVSTTIPIHTGEEIYLRENFKDLIEKQAVNIVGPDPEDVGGIAEMKWIAEYADLHGIAMAPHGTANGIFGLAALIQVCATLPDNFIAFEYPARFEPFWYEITEGFDGVPVHNGMIAVPDRPGLGVNLIPEAARPYLSEGDADFFD
jgi:L-alanine-DL-glutamate epimerase-like enolase superfamily enzyme